MEFPSIIRPKLYQSEPQSVVETDCQMVWVKLCVTCCKDLYTVEPLGTDTSLSRTVSYVPTKFSYISSKKTSTIWTLSNADNGHKIRPLGANSYKRNLFITDTPGQGVDNLRYMYHFLSAVTQTLTLHRSGIPIPEHVLGEVFRFVSKFVCTACN